MIDKQIMKLPGMKQLLGLLAGLSFLQALFIIGQAYGLARAITGLWEGRSIYCAAFSLARSVFFCTYSSIVPSSINSFKILFSSSCSSVLPLGKAIA